MITQISVCNELTVEMLTSAIPYIPVYHISDLVWGIQVWKREAERGGGSAQTQEAAHAFSEWVLVRDREHYWTASGRSSKSHFIVNSNLIMTIKTPFPEIRLWCVNIKCEPLASRMSTIFVQFVLWNNFHICKG